jgi:hypothetical protein
VVPIDSPVIDGKKLAGEAQALLAALKARLAASIALQDLHRREALIWMSDFWMSRPTAREETPIGMRDPDGRQLSAPINWRWTLWAAPDTTFPDDAFVVLAEAAQKLAGFLPADKVPDVPTPISGTPGGTSGPAELGIPVAWARKVRN